MYPEWLEFKRKHTRADNYIERIHRDWKAYYEGTDITKTPIKKLTKKDLDLWAHELIKKYDMDNKRYYNVSLIMRQALDYAADEKKIIEFNYFSRIKISRNMFRHVKKPKSETQVFSVEDLERIEELAWKCFNNPAKSRKHMLTPLAMVFMFQTGVRVGEVIALKYEDISEDGKWIHVQRLYRYETKMVVEHTKETQGDRIVPLPKHAIDIIAAARKKQENLGVATDRYIFSVSDDPLSYQSVQYLFYRFCEQLGIEAKSPNKSRKTYISTLLDAGINLNTVREYVGHLDEQTTLHNYYFDRDSKEEKRKKVDEALTIKGRYND